MAEAEPPAQSPTSSSSQSALETFHLEHMPQTHSVHVAVFRDVQNAAFLQQQLLARNADFEYAFIDAGVVRKGTLSLFH
jgi:EKC/KEOPS complex subunit CGI121/TPRKB